LNPPLWPREFDEYAAELLVASANDAGIEPRPVSEIAASIATALSLRMIDLAVLASAK